MIKISSLIIATIIGAGFSSGREIYTFFNKYQESIYIILISSFFVFYFTIYYTLKLGFYKKIDNYSDFLNLIFKDKISTNYEKIMKIFLLIIFSIMIAGFGEFLNLSLGIPRIIGSLILIVLCIFTLLGNINRIMKVSTYIVPMIILAIVYLFYIELRNLNIIIADNIKDINFFSGIIYASYNLVIAIPVIVSSSQFINNKKQIKYISLLSSIILVILIYLIYIIQNDYTYLIKDIAMPLLYIAKMQSAFMYYIYCIIIGLSIYSTAISTQYSLVEKYKDKNYILSIIITSCVSLIISFVSFNKLIDYCFPIIGIVGIAQTIFIIKSVKMKKKVINNN